MARLKLISGTYNNEVTILPTNRMFKMIGSSKTKQAEIL